MTLNQWLTTTDPSAMFDALGDQADERRLVLFQKSCRDASGLQFHGQVLGRKYDIEAWISRPQHHFPSVSMRLRCDLIRCLWPPPMMERERMECPECKNWSIRQKESITRMNCKTCNDTLFALTPLINPRWRTPLVMDLARKVGGTEIGKEPDPELMPILADAIEEAGCDVPEIGEHLRCGVHVAGDKCWVIAEILN